jgi:cytochrome c oxidase cbb3-type subunit 3
MKRTIPGFLVLFAGAIAASSIVAAQTPARGAQAPAQPATNAPDRGRGARAGGQAPVEDYPQRPPADPAVLERGKALYSANCSPCHGVDARGGNNGGPNLLRSQLVLSDRSGELIADVVQKGRSGTAMAPFNLSTPQISDIAAFIHSFRVGGYDISREQPKTIVVGNVAAGQAVFQSKCVACHSAIGDLKGIGARFNDAKDLQQTWLMPSNGRGGRGAAPTTATVTLPSGQNVEGRLIRIDDFVVTVALADGTERTFARNGASPRVETRDPLQPHRDLLAKYTDDEIHDVTAYLASLK